MFSRAMERAVRKLVTSDGLEFFGTSEVTCQARQVIASGQAHENVEGSESAEAASGLIYSQCAKSHA